MLQEIPGANNRSTVPPAKVVTVWDLPIRLFHWSLAITVIVAVATGLIGGEAMEWHIQAGYGIVVLVAFRLLWGVFGTRHARFRSFVRSLPTTYAHVKKSMRGKAPHGPGHSPVAGWMVMAMLGVLAVQTVTGLFANDDIDTEGPLFHLVSKHTSDVLSAIHKLNFWVVVGLIGLHLLAIFGYYLIVRRINLIRPMITGRMRVAAEHATEHHIPRHTNALALALLVLLAGGFYFFVLRG
jgi:cytochrome b